MQRIQAKQAYKPWSQLNIILINLDYTIMKFEMKSEKTGKVAIQLKNNIHKQERDKTQKKTEKIQEKRVLRACLKQNIVDI